MRHVDISEALFAVNLASDLLNYGEPMPTPKSHNITRLDASIHQPFVTYDGKDLYESIADKAAVMFYGVIKNHPLENGNKRTAVVVTMLLLYFNHLMFSLTPGELYDLACSVAESSASSVDKEIEGLRASFEERIVELDSQYA